MMRPLRPRERGIALLLVVWVFMILGVLALDFSRYMRDDAMASVNFSEEARGYYIAVAGMNRTLFDVMQAREEGRDFDDSSDDKDAEKDGGSTKKDGKPGLSDDEDRDVPPDGKWHREDFAGGSYEVRMTDESGRISLRTAHVDLLKYVAMNLIQGPNAQVKGMDRRTQGEIDTIANSIIDWRDTDDDRSDHGAESPYYLKHGGYRAKNSFFDSPEELLLVRGVTAEIFYGHDGQPGLRDIVSVSNKSAKLNVAWMPDAVVQVLLGVTHDEVDDLRNGSEDDGLMVRLSAALAAGGVSVTGGGETTGAEALGGNNPLNEAGAADPLELVDNKNPGTVFVEARADVRQERNRSCIAAVVDMGGSDLDGPKVRRWFDRAPWTGVMPSAPADDGSEGQS
jgi:type II secretory pathway component PulK